MRRPWKREQRSEGVAEGGRWCHDASDILLLSGSFEPFKMELFKEAIKPQMVVVDVGAYVGYHTVLASRLSEPQAKIYAFECDPKNYRFLVHNVKLNNCTNVAATPRAVGDKAGVMAFSLEEDPYTSNFGHHGARALLSEVECASLDEMLGGQPRRLKTVGEETYAQRNAGGRKNFVYLYCSKDG